MTGGWISEVDRRTVTLDHPGLRAIVLDRQPTEIQSDAIVNTSAGSVARLAKGGWLVPSHNWHSIVGELERLQTLEIRLEAENDSLKVSLRKQPSTWHWIAMGLFVGFSAGMAVENWR